MANPHDDGPFEPLLQAAQRAFARYGVRKTTLEDIAKEAGLSRSTIYRALGTKDEIRYKLRQAHYDRGFRWLDRKIPEGTPVREALVTYQEFTLEYTLKDPVTPRLMETEPASLLSVLVEPEGGPSQYLQIADFIGSLLRDRCPDVDRLRVTPVQAAEVLTRLTATRLLGRETYLGDEGSMADMLLDGLYASD